MTEPRDRRGTAPHRRPWSEPVDVLVVGAGPVGLTLAIGLTRLGASVRVVDRAPRTKREPRAGVVWPRALEVLDDLGAVERFADRGLQLHHASVVASGRSLGTLDNGTVDSAHRYPLAIEQHDTERLLGERLAELGVGIEWQTELTDLQEHPDRVVAALRDPTGRAGTVEAAWVVGCEGTRSRVREAAGIDFVGRRRPNLQILQVNADVRWRRPDDRRHARFFLAPGVSLGVTPVPAGGYRLFCFTTDPDPAVTAAPTVDELRDRLAGVSRERDVELTATEPRWANRARFSDRVATRLRAGRLLLAGDAAHAWAPVGGRGMNTGMRGAHNLAWKLAAVVAGQAPESLLDSYDVEQRATARAVMAEMRANVLELPLPPVAYWPAMAALAAAMNVPGAGRRVERLLSDLDRHHRGSELSVDAVDAAAATAATATAAAAGARGRGGRGGGPGAGSRAWPGTVPRRGVGAGPRAGDRVPDVPVVAGQVAGRRRLHQLLSYERWTLLVEPGAHSAALRQVVERHRPPIEVVEVTAGGRDAARSLGATGQLLLVRPDRHVALRAAADDAVAVDSYLARHACRG